jgi:pimeloyl-ACP methyl ester carboxylesterase
MRHFLSRLSNFLIFFALSLIFILISAMANPTTSTDPNESLERNGSLQEKFPNQDITMEQVKNSAPLPQVPFVVLTAGDRTKGMPPVFSEKAVKEMAELGIEMQKKLAAMIPGGKHIIVNDVGHNIHMEKPEALITPVIEMIKEVRKSK